MLAALLYGFVVGFMLCLTLGTVFFSLIQNSIDYGYKTGIYIATGVVISDSILIIFAIAGTGFLPDIPHFKTYATIVCSALVFVMGIGSILKQANTVSYPQTKFGGVFYFASTGFLLNFLNPVNFLVWAALSARLTSENQYTLTHQLFFFAGALLSIFLTEVGISFSAAKLKHYIKPQQLVWVNRITGSIFILIACKLIYDLIFSTT